MISVVIPVYNEGKPLESFCNEIISCLHEIQQPFEIILIDDCSKDDSWQVISNITSHEKRIKAARLIKNFGQHSALTAGLKIAKGDYIVLMDCDGQDDPQFIFPMLDKLKKSHSDIIYARRINRQSSAFSIIGSLAINKIMEFLSGYKHDPKVGTYRIISRKVVEAYFKLPEKRRYLGGLFYWLGFRFETLEVKHRSRTHGKSNYNFKKLLQLARLGILGSSAKILSLGTYIGLISGTFSFLFGIYFIIQKILHDVPLGFTAIVTSIFFVGSIIMILLGIIGEYLGEVFYEVKGRPNYLIYETINIENEKI